MFINVRLKNISTSILGKNDFFKKYFYMYKLIKKQ